MLQAIVDKATCQKAPDRYAGVTELAADLRRYLRGEASVFVLHGNVHDVILDGDDLVVGHMGAGAKIGSNAVVTKAVPAGATAVGIPGRCRGPAGDAAAVSAGDAVI